MCWRSWNARRWPIQPDEPDSGHRAFSLQMTRHHPSVVPWNHFSPAPRSGIRTTTSVPPAPALMSSVPPSSAVPHRIDTDAAVAGADRVLDAGHRPGPAGEVRDRGRPRGAPRLVRGLLLERAAGHRRLRDPYKPVDYWPYAGITRSVWIEAVAETSVPKVLINAVDGVLEVRAVVENTGGRQFRGSVVVRPQPSTSGRETRAAVEVHAGGVRV
jgi:hypothetical protein